mmetsp:Transcript_77703/g.137609  ORF Transcript_77703/g.137609 Transcript_77703/m.137609 type:complete len:239 (-) Transcript_77703:179-895(-)
MLVESNPDRHRCHALCQKNRHCPVLDTANPDRHAVFRARLTGNLVCQVPQDANLAARSQFENLWCQAAHNQLLKNCQCQVGYTPGESQDARSPDEAAVLCPEQAWTEQAWSCKGLRSHQVQGHQVHQYHMESLRPAYPEQQEHLATVQSLDDKAQHHRAGWSQILAPAGKTLLVVAGPHCQDRRKVPSRTHQEAGQSHCAAFPASALWVAGNSLQETLSACPLAPQLDQSSCHAFHSA